MSFFTDTRHGLGPLAPDVMRTLWFLLLLGFGFWALLGLLAYLMQERLLYLPDIPGRSLVATPQDLGLQFEDVRLSTSNAVVIHAWSVPAAGVRYSVIFFHGNAGNISHRLDWLRILNRLRLEVLLIEYRGYGASEGRPSEEGTHRDALAAWNFLHAERALPACRIVLFGESLGGAVAARLATSVPAAGLILFSAFSSIADIAAYHYRFLPVRRLLQLNYPTRDYVARAAQPVLVMHSADDEIVPFAQAQLILQGAGDRAVFVQTAGDHNSGFLQSEFLIQKAIASFLDTLEARRQC